MASSRQIQLLFNLARETLQAKNNLEKIKFYPNI
jgi:hypothetical protein